MSVWTFYDFIEDSGNVPFDEWMTTLPAEAQAFIDGRILQMMGLLKWMEKWASTLEGYEKLIELRIPHKKVQYRPLGIYRPGYSFVLLGGAIERNNKLPEGTLDAAVRRQKAIETGTARFRVHRFDPRPAMGEDAG